MSGDETKRPRMLKEVESLIAFNNVFDGFPTTPRTSRQDGSGGQSGSGGKRARRDRDDDEADTPPKFPEGTQRRFLRKLVTRPTGVGMDRIVVFVEPAKETDTYWHAAMVVPTVEYDASMGHARPGECIVRYFADLKFSVIPVWRLAVFAEDREPYLSFRHMEDFQNDKGIIAALRMLRSGILPNGFKWQLWDDAAGPGIEESEAERKSTRSGRGGKKQSEREETPTRGGAGAAAASSPSARAASPAGTSGAEIDVETFAQQLNALMAARDTPIKKTPTVSSQPLDPPRLLQLYRAVTQRGGHEEVTRTQSWRAIYDELGFPNESTSAAYSLRSQYVRYLAPYEEKYFVRSQATAGGKGRVQPKVGDRVSVYSVRDNREYQAKVLSIQGGEGDDASWDADRKYFVHYLGWNSHYDEWVPHTHILQVLDDDAATIPKMGKDSPLAKPPSTAASPSGAATASPSSSSTSLTSVKGEGSRTPRKTSSSPKEETPSSSSAAAVSTPATGTKAGRRSPSPSSTTASASKKRRTDDSPGPLSSIDLAALAAPPPRRAAAAAAAMAVANAVSGRDDGTRRTSMSPAASSSSATASRRTSSGAGARNGNARASPSSASRSSRSRPSSRRNGDAMDVDDADRKDDEDEEDEGEEEEEEEVVDAGDSKEAAPPAPVTDGASSTAAVAETDAKGADLKVEGDGPEAVVDNTVANKSTDVAATASGQLSASDGANGAPDAEDGEEIDRARRRGRRSSTSTPAVRKEEVASETDEDGEEGEEGEEDDDKSRPSASTTSSSTSRGGGSKKRRRGGRVTGGSAAKRRRRRDGKASQDEGDGDEDDEREESEGAAADAAPNSPAADKPTDKSSKTEHLTPLAMALRVPEEIRARFADHHIDWEAVFPDYSQRSCAERIDCIEKKMSELKAQYRRYRQIIEKMVKRAQRSGRSAVVDSPAA